MIGSTSIDLSLKNIWHCYYLFRHGKKTTKELDNFQYRLEENLYQLYRDLNDSSYRLGSCREFVVTDNKKRQIKVAPIRDRIVHRILYEYLYPIFDPTFIYDIWSCRLEKGLTGAIKRTQKFMSKDKNSFIWRSDIRKFFDNVDHQVLQSILARKITDTKAKDLLKKIINSSPTLNRKSNNYRPRGIPIGNLTSQIFANIYLGEFNNYIKHQLHIKYYLRYGDDFIIIKDNRDELCSIQIQLKNFLTNYLHLEVNSKNSIIVKSKSGIKFLGVWIYPHGHNKLISRNQQRIESRLDHTNFNSYYGLIKQSSSPRFAKYYNYFLLTKKIII